MSSASLEGLNAACIALLVALPLHARAESLAPPIDGLGQPPVAGAPLPATSAEATGGGPSKAGGGGDVELAPGVEEKPLVWDFSWRGWDGLHMSASRKIQVPDRLTDLPVFEFEKIKLATRIGGRVEVDAAAFATTGNLSGFDSGVELRRARITARGDSIVAVPFSYKIDLGYVPNKFTVTQAYIEIPDIPYLGSVKFGQFKPPLGLQLITSSWDIPLMEPAAPLQAIAPGSNPGVQIGRSFHGGRGTWAFALYGDTGGSGEYGNTSKNFGNAVGRVTWLAIDRMNATRPGDNQYLHLGLSANVQYSGRGEVRYRSRPESYIAPYVIDTGTIDASQANTVGAEVAWVSGPFSAQGEFVRSEVDASVGGALQFHGFYALASWYLTGESRPYDREDGKFGRLVPRRKFAFGEDGGWGAAEAVVRFSYTDLNDGAVQGGRLTMLMTSFNWYPQPHLTWMLDVGFGDVGGGAYSGRTAIVQTRVGVDL